MGRRVQMTPAQLARVRAVAASGDPAHAQPGPASGGEAARLVSPRPAPDSAPRLERVVTLSATPSSPALTCQEPPTAPDLTHPAVLITLPEVLSKSNHRNATGRPGTWSRLRDFEQALALRARSCLPPGWAMGDPARPVPTRPAVVMVIWARTLLDAANLAKSIPDALQGVAYHSDASVCHVVTMAERCSGPGRGIVGFAQLPPSSSTRQRAAAAGLLQEAVLDWAEQLSA